MSGLIAADPTIEFRRSSELRAVSQQALFRAVESRALRAAASARPRTQPRRHFREGSVVYVWRENRQVGSRGWVGPGVVVCINPTSASVWVTIRGTLLKCCSEHVREVTDEESIGAEVAKLLSREALSHLQRAGHRGFVDTTGEAGPPEDGVDVPPAADASGGMQAPRGGIDATNPRFDTIPEGGNQSETTSAIVLRGTTRTASGAVAEVRDGGLRAGDGTDVATLHAEAGVPRDG